MANLSFAGLHTHCCDLATSLDGSKNAPGWQNEQNPLIDVRTVLDLTPNLGLQTMLFGHLGHSPCSSSMEPTSTVATDEMSGW